MLSRRLFLFLTFFFFQAEDGIRDGHVTGVQTCALPIFKGMSSGVSPWIKQLNNTAVSVDQLGTRKGAIAVYLDVRSEERRVGKECRSQWAAEQARKKKEERVGVE